jgi:VWFA-related protein
MRPQLPLVLILIATSALGQTTIPRVDEIVEVRVVSFDVIVTGPDGNHVRGLTKGDFELFENGARQEITNLSEIRVEPETVETDPPSPRRIVVFVDALSTDTLARKRACTAVAAFLGRELRPDDEAMVVIWNRTLAITVPPTNNFKLLEKGLAKAAAEVSAGRLASLLRERGGGREGMVRARMHRNMMRQELAATATAVNGVLARLAGSEGRKALILITESFSTSPGRDLADPEAGSELDDPDDIRAASVVEQVARNANAAGVTVYAMHARGLESGISVEETSAAAASQRVQRGVSNSIEGLSILAERTGGLAVTNSNDFRRGLDRVARDLSSYYSLGYRVRSQHVDRERNISIRARDNRLTVRARRTFVERSFESEITGAVVANLYFPGSANQLGIAVAQGAVTREGRNRLKMPVDVKIPMASLTLEPFGDAYAADVTIFIAAADPAGAMSTVEQFRRRIPVKREELPKLVGMHYTYGLDVDLRTTGRGNRFAVAVLDNVSKMTGFAAADVDMKRK